MYSSSDDEFVNLEPFRNPLPHNSPWLPYSSDHFVAPRCGGSDDVNGCISLTRISIVLCYYKQWLDERLAVSESLHDCDEKKEENVDGSNSMYDFINKVFDAENGYSNHQLLNDYHHLIADHSHQFENIYARISKQCKHKDDDIATSYLMKRNYRNKQKFNRSQHDSLYFSFATKNSNEEKAAKERCIQQILDTICCYFLYSYAIGYIANPVMQNEIKSNENEDGDDDDDDKRPSHVRGLVFKSFGRASLSKKKRYKKHAQVQEMLNMFTWIKSNRNKLAHSLPPQVYHAIYQPKNKFMSIALFAPQNEEKEESDEKVQEFGYRFYYSANYKNSAAADEFNDGYKYKDFYICALYKSLKEEALNSAAYKIDIEQWHDLYEKADCYFSCDIAKKMKASSGKKMAEGSSITMNHLLSILLYTNHRDIEYQLSATCRKKSASETNESLKERNSHLAILSSFLSETVQCFAAKAAFNKRLEYFHVIDKAVNMPSAIKYAAPLSTTTSSMVAMNVLYSYEHQTDGLLLEIGARETKQFDCKYFSDHTAECEMLFFHCEKAITVQNVIDVALGINYHIFLYGFRLINAMLDGSDLNKKQRGMHFQVSDTKIVTPIYNFLYHKFYGKKKQFGVESLPVYVEKIFNCYFAKLTKIKISWNQMHKIRRKMNGYGEKNTFNMKMLVIIQPFLCYSHIEWIKWHLMIHAFPKLKCITIHSIKLSRAMFEDMLFHIGKLSKKGNECSVFEEILLKSPNQSKLGCAQATQIFNKRFAKFNWKITKINHYELQIRRDAAPHSSP